VRWLELALQTDQEGIPPRPRAWALTVSGLLANVCGEPKHAADLLAESLDWWDTDRRLAR
jgi:hypothetical protein